MKWQHQPGSQAQNNAGMPAVDFLRLGCGALVYKLQIFSTNQQYVKASQSAKERGSQWTWAAFSLPTAAVRYAFLANHGENTYSFRRP